MAYTVEIIDKKNNEVVWQSVPTSLWHANMISADKWADIDTKRYRVVISHDSNIENGN